EHIVLRQGHSVAEAGTGDSVPASFDSKFYRCYEPFDLVEGTNQLSLNCKIANVVASVNASTIDEAQVKNLHVTVSTSNGMLEFDESNFKTSKGYFMMPYDADGNRESVLNIKIEGENILGEPFVKTRKVENVKPAYEYVVNLSYDASGDDPQGGGYLVVTVDESEILVASTVEIFAAPAIEGVDFDIDKQIVGEPGQFVGDRQVKVVAFDEISSFTIECRDAGNLNLPSQTVDLKTVDDVTIAQIHDAGITWDKTVEDVVNNKDGHTRQLSYITFSETYLNSLPARDDEYRIRLTATDGNGKTTAKTLRIAVGENAIVYDAPVVADDVQNSENYMAIGARRATLTLSIKDENATNPGIRYREAGTGDWTTVPMTRSRANIKGTVTLTGLKPGTRYEYQAVADGYTPSESLYFTTEGQFVIPNASLEEWSDFSENSKVLIPGAGGERTFWDSGNHGSATMSVTLTQKSEEMFHSGSLSARLRSQFVGLGALGKFAAGNLFAGEYYKTNGTNGEIYFGREYNGSHPSALKVFVNYRPGVADKNGSKGGKLKQGDQDMGQIYVALTTEKVHIDTRYPDTMLWNTDADCVLAYGEKLFEGDYGPDGQLQELTIPINYNAKAKTRKPVYLVIVCTASYYGDYFDGGEGSTMYVDDFELVYE
ncbi:MAG: PCMD domain-containing protein, partial [Muribaculaceae bacterium]|nr:PCMD domain-containing protein [Muribaculaceae bacterium]